MKYHKIICFLLFFQLIITSSLNAQEKAPKRISLPSGGFNFSGNVSSIKIPFRLSDNLIIIQVELNGKQLNLIFDSGMPIEGAILFGSPKVDSTNLVFSGKAPIGGVDGKRIESDLATGVVLKVPNLQLTNQMLIVMPYDQARSNHFEGMDGIIGFSFFSKFVVEIDYENHFLTISKPEAFNPADKGEEIPIDVRQNRIFLNAQVNLNNGAAVDAELVIDTGNRSPIMLNTGYNNKLVVPAKNIPIYVFGLSGKMSRKAGRIKNIKLGKYALTDVLASFNEDKSGTPPWEKEGNLGNPALKRFNVTFNVPGKHMYFKKNKLFPEPFDYNMAGFQFQRTDDLKFKIINVIPGSPAEKAGMVLGDEIIKMNNKPISQITKDEAENELQQAGRELSIIIERNGKQISLKLHLTKFI